MYVQFKCFKCESIQKKVIHSYSSNQEKPFKIEELCEHFSDIELKWTTKWGFFTLGWKVTIYDVSVNCKEHPKEQPEYKRRIYFANETFQRGEIFNKGVNKYEEIHECCNNIIVYSAYEGDFYCSDDGKIRQQKINNYIEEIKADKEELQKLKEEEEKLEKEEKLRKQKEEEERREREEEEKKEKEKRRRSQYEKKNKEMLEIIKQQEKEEKELNKRVNIGASWIEEQMSQMISEANTTYSKNINFNAQKMIKANFQFKAVKS